DCHADPETELRALRPGPATGVHGGADLQLRVHLLRRLRRAAAAQRLPELRRRPGASARTAEGDAGEASGLAGACRQAADVRAPGRAAGTLSRRAAGRALKQGPAAPATE